MPHMAEPCPKEYLHTLQPEGYLQWHEWAEKLSATHEEIKCDGCDRYAIWVLKITV